MSPYAGFYVTVFFVFTKTGSCHTFYSAVGIFHLVVCLFKNADISGTGLHV